MLASVMQLYSSASKSSGWTRADAAQHLPRLLRHLRRQAPPQGLQDHARLRRPPPVLRLRVPVHADRPRPLPRTCSARSSTTTRTRCCSSTSAPPKAAATASSPPSASPIPPSIAPCIVVDGDVRVRVPSSASLTVRQTLPDRADRATAARIGRRAARLPARADAQRVRLLPAAVLLRVGRGRLRAQRRHGRRRAAPRAGCEAKRRRAAELRGAGRGRTRSTRARSSCPANAPADRQDRSRRRRDGGASRPVDYKRARRATTDDGPEAWPADRVQVAVQALVLRDNGYRCDEAIVYYIDDQAARARRRSTRRSSPRRSAPSPRRARWPTRRIPPPLVDSPKCPRCSLVAICLPDETAPVDGVCRDQDARQLALVRAERLRIPAGARHDRDRPGRDRSVAWSRRATTSARSTSTGQGLSVGKSGEVLQVKDKDEASCRRCASTRSARSICSATSDLDARPCRACARPRCRSPISPSGGWFYGITHGTGLEERLPAPRRSSASPTTPVFRLRWPRDLVAGKIRNQRTMLQRNHVEPPPLRACSA